MPFGREQFLEVFGAYNTAVFPSQLVLIVGALLAIRLASMGGRFSSKSTALILAVLWLWAGIVYHLVFFTAINPLAFVFGTLFVLQSLLLLKAGVVTDEVCFARRSDAGAVLGTVLVVYSLIVYPILGVVFGQSYPYSPTFGTPCTTTIFTLGILARCGIPIPGHLLIIPLAWSLVGTSAAYLFGIWEDLGLVVAGVVGVYILVGNSGTDVLAEPG